jgi:REP element-mobilizing transposase RayT
MKKATENTLPKRRSPRASWIDYNEGEYFITVCTQEKIHYFGEIVNDVMCFTPIGAFLDTQLKEVNVHHPHIEILTYTVMPNHFHAIVRIGSINGMDNKGNMENADATSRVPTGMDRLNYRVGERNAITGQRNVPLLSTFVGSLKAAVSRHASKNGIQFSWQSRYHDHTIRSVEERNHIAQYIINNVLNWSKDCFY